MKKRRKIKQGKERKRVPVPLQRELLLESGFECSMHLCHESSGLEFHHIDGDRSNTVYKNLLVLCEKHHGMARRNKKLDTIACRILKKNLEDSYKKNKRISKSEVVRGVMESLLDLHGNKFTLKSVKAPGRIRKLSKTEIKKIRKELTVSVEVFAHLLNVSHRTVYSWESGKTKPKGAALRLLCIVKKQPKMLFEL